MNFALRLLIGWISGLSIATADSSLSAKAIALNCQTCHQQAAGDDTIPDLGTLNRQQLRQSLLAFRQPGNPATIMPRLVKGYSDAELLAVADYLTPR